jgi:ubiquinone biosynthesis monooxygenase Coq7
MQNRLSIDRFILEFDRGLRTLTRQKRTTQRDNPAKHLAEPQLTEQERKRAARLMRVNHAGEVAAQGLYHGQALTAHDTKIIDAMHSSAREEEDHLAWCEERLNELHSHPSLLGPLWYLGSYGLGATAGFFGDRWSLGFVGETEKQVEQHLTDHLSKLPEEDHKSRSILAQMQEDERMHGDKAMAMGGEELPTPVKKIMKLVSRVMTTGAYWA